METLTPREREILGLLVLGLTNREIAARLHLSVRTVETHRANLQSKLEVRRRSELVAYAIAHRLPTLGASLSDEVAKPDAAVG